MKPSDYVFGTEPLEFQREEFLAHADTPERFIAWDQGLGKSKLAIDTCAYLYQKGEINGVVVCAPNSVSTTWALDELPKHLPPAVSRESRIHLYRPERADTKWHQQALKDLTIHPGLPWLIMTYGALSASEPAKKFLLRFLDKRRCMMVLDESSNIQTPSAKRTFSIAAAGRRAIYRRCLDGTPCGQSPFDLYSQVRFLDEQFWARKGLATAAAFKAEFGEYERGWNSRQGREYPILRGYRNIDRLQRWFAEISTRLTKDEKLNLPGKIYHARYFELTPEQRRIYAELRDDFIATLDSGVEVSAPLALTRLLRLQQVANGFIPHPDPGPDDEPIVRLPGRNPRLELLLEIVEPLNEPAIIWSRFRADVDLICAALGSRAVRYDGSCDTDAREESRRRFKAGEAQFFVATQSAGATGLTLTEAAFEVFYSNTPSARQRAQAEDRAYRIGQTRPVQIIDLLGEGTIDRNIALGLRSSFDIASQITGDRLKEWLTV